MFSHIPWWEFGLSSVKVRLVKREVAPFSPPALALDVHADGPLFRRYRLDAAGVRVIVTAQGAKSRPHKRFQVLRLPAPPRTHARRNARYIRLFALRRARGRARLLAETGS